MNFTTFFRNIRNTSLQTLSRCLGQTPPPPLLAPVLAYILGSSAAFLIEKPDPILLQLAPVAIIVLVLWRKSPGRFSVLATALLWGAVATWVALVPDPYHAELIQEIENQEVVLQGRVLQVEPQPQRWRMDLQLKSIRHNGRSAEAANMRVRIHVASATPANPPQIYAGDHVILRTSLRKPRPFGTPGEFNYARYLIQRDIVASGFVADAESIARMAPAHPPALSARIARWRQHTGAEIAALLPQESSAYVLSLALGEKTRLSPNQREVLAFTGLSHLFSISGLHLGMIAAFIYVVLQSIYRRSTSLLLWQPVQKAVPLLCLPGVIVYLFMSGGALPTLRATAMLCVAALIALLDYRTRPGAILLLVGGLILIADPLALYSASFQLSFAGAGALLLVLPVWHRRLKPGWRRRGILLLLTSYTAFLATAPFALWHFHTLAPAAMINNIFAVPLVSFIVLPITLGATALFSIAPDLSLPLLEWSGTMISIILESAQKIAVGPLSGRYIYPSLHAFSAASLICAALVLWAARLRTWGSAALGGAVAVILFSMIPGHSPERLQLHALSIGQADAFLIRTPDNRAYLVDGGGLYSDTFDTGSQLIAPALQRLGVSGLDAIILSHDHPDHSKGLEHLLRYFPVDAFLSGIPPTHLNHDLRRALNHPGAPPAIQLPEGLIQLDEYIYLHTPDQDHAKVNERSVAVFGGLGSEGFLLTGDLETQGMSRLLDLPPPTPVTLFKLPHHGSRNSAPERWLDTWDISQTVVSCGYNNHFGFPHAYICEMLKHADIPLWRTDIHGSIHFSTNGRGWEVWSHKIPPSPLDSTNFTAY